MSAPGPTIDRVAELLSQGLTTTEIRHQLKLTKGSIQSYMRRIRLGLGAQAI